MSTNKESWGSRIGLVLAVAGNAVGLGNFLRFPVQAVQNGGGAFIIPYIVCFLLMGIPLLWVEWATGRFGGRFGNHSTPFILDSLSSKPYWKYFGIFSIFINIAVAGYYCYIESWTMAYVFHSVLQTFSGMSQPQVAAFFNDYVDLSKSTTGIPYEAIVFYLICLGINVYILSRGISGGVEVVAKIGMPLLILFGAFLAIRGLTLGSSGAYPGCRDCDAVLGLNFLWNPQYDSLYNPKVWLAAAGQIFFTLAVGMGTIQCFAAYVRANDDIALNAMSAGWTNEFVEVVLGAAIIIPISVGYLGLDWVKENAGFAMGFQTMPYLFAKWGPLFGTLAGMAWFGLLFFAGITSSLAMGTPWMGLMQDEFNWSRKKAAWAFGGLTLIMGLPAIVFYQQGVLDEIDYWAGSVALVIFGLAEVILFAWVFGMERGWKEINDGAEIRVPLIFKSIIKYVTPLLLLLVFFGSLVQPKDNDWFRAFSGDWELDNNSIIGKITNKGIVANRSYISNLYESEVAGIVERVDNRDENHKQVFISEHKTYYYDEQGKTRPYTPELGDIQIFDSLSTIKVYTFGQDAQITALSGSRIRPGDPIAKGGPFINPIAYIDGAKLLLLALFVFSGYLIWKAEQNRKKRERMR